MRDIERRVRKLEDKTPPESSEASLRDLARAVAYALYNGIKQEPGPDRDKAELIASRLGLNLKELRRRGYGSLG